MIKHRLENGKFVKFKKEDLKHGDIVKCEGYSIENTTPIYYRAVSNVFMDSEHGCFLRPTEFTSDSQVINTLKILDTIKNMDISCYSCKYYDTDDCYGCVCNDRYTLSENYSIKLAIQILDDLKEVINNE